MSPRFEVVFQPYGKRGTFPKGTSVYEAARELGVDIAGICGGKGTCGKCKVKALQGAERLSPLTAKEMEGLSSEDVAGSYRLACQALIQAPAVIFVPEWSRLGRQRLQIEGIEVPVEPLPVIRKYYLELPVPTIQDPRSDEDRILDALKEEHSILNPRLDLKVARDLPVLLREADWKVTVVVWGNERIIAVEPGETADRCYGFAIDVGSTKLAGFLMDLNKGKVVAIDAKTNPQVTMGEDILSRISYAMTHADGSGRLQRAVISGINGMIENCCKKAKVKPDEIYELNFVGNTAMQLLLLGVSPRSVALSPYPPIIRRGIDVPARELGLRVNSNANAHHFPVIGGFVGADNVAVILATGMLESDEMTMAIDVGTNTEIDLGNEDGVMADSCASGPAFEGMEIKHGMRAATGAIERVSIEPSTLEVAYRVIDDVPPVGLCGSALVDVPAELLKAGLMGFEGRFIPRRAGETNRLRRGTDGIWEFVIAWKDEASVETDVVVTQKDIRELQKAKAAMHTGAALMMRRLGITENDIGILYVAGAFGNYIDPESARTIGMYPELPLEKIKFVGNAAGTGSRVGLISAKMRDYAEKISRTVKYYELAADPEFQDEYVRSLYFPHKDLDRYPLTREFLERLGRRPR